MNTEKSELEEKCNGIIADVINSALLKDNLKEYLDSNSSAGGLYGLTISNEDFIKGLIKAIKLSLQDKPYKRPKDKTKYKGWVSHCL